MEISDKDKIIEQNKEWASLQQERGKVMQSSSEATLTKIKEFEKEVASLTKKLEEKSAVFLETDDLLKTVQFENDEVSIKVEKYENIMKDHQTVLAENETFIEQLNKEVSELEKKLKEYEAKESLNSIVPGTILHALFCLKITVSNS